jgi:hypothetical protein
LDIGFIHQLIHTTQNYKHLATLSLLSTLYKSLNATSSPTCSFKSRSLATDVNSGNSTDYHAQVLPSSFQYKTACQLPSDSGVGTPELDCRFSIELHAQIIFCITTFPGPIRKHIFHQYLYCRRGLFTDSIFRNVLHNTIVLLLCACILRAFPSNCRCLQSPLSNGSICHSILISSISPPPITNRDYWLSGLRSASGILKNTAFRQLDLHPSSGEWIGHTSSVGSARTCRPVQKASNPECYTPLSESLEKNKLRGLSPQANYTDGATAACR